jgi:ATP-binding cassette subfamily B multidrug efflux pump
MKISSQIDDISGTRFQRNVGKRILPYLRPHILPLSMAVSLVFVSAGVSLYSPKLLGRIVDEALVPKNQTLLWQLGFLYIGLELLRLAAVFTQSYWLQKIGQVVMQDIRSDLFGRLLHMPVSFFDKNPSGKLVTRVTNDTVNLSELFSSGFVMLLSDIMLIVGVISAMLLLHPGLGLWTVSVFPLMIVTMVVFSGKLRHAFRRSRDVLSKLNSFFAERMAGMPVVQLMERESFERESYLHLSQDYRERQFEGVHLYSLFHPIITILGGISVTMVIWFGPQYIAAGAIPLGTFVSFLAYAQVLYQPVRNITDRYNIFLAAMASAERIFSLIDMDEESELRFQKPAHPKPFGTLEFRNVSFRYPSERNIEQTEAIRNLNFSLARGQTAAIVGHTGAGKSTLISLLFRFYEPSAGSVLLGGEDLRNFPKAELRSRIGFVQQDVFLFSGSLRDNLTLISSQNGAPISDEEILKACAQTGFDRVLTRLPRGLDTELDEKGSNLSLGQRQILAFTRVYLQKPDILVLDEATSSVDRESEILLQQATQVLMKGRTSLVIAHRLETVRHADKILVLEKGQLMEEGDHAALMAREGGIYARFVSFQQKNLGH